MKEKEINNDVIACFNSNRIYYLGRKFSAKEMSEILSKVGLFKSHTFRPFAIKYGLICATGAGYNTEYSFPKDPVYYQKIINAVNEFREYCKQYNSKPDPVEVVVEQTVQPKSESSEQIAIALLKELGYVIIKII